MKKQSVEVNMSKDKYGAIVQATDKQFFDALIRSDTETLDRILSDDLIIIDVMRGAETTKPEFVGAIGSGLVQFDKIEIRDNRVRLYDSTAVITGQTRLTLRFNGISSVISSRYTHVYCELEGQWRLVSAQGTSIQLP